jgi:hypothetical protein
LTEYLPRGEKVRAAPFRLTQRFAGFFFIGERKFRAMSSPSLPARRDAARHLIEQARVALVYLGIIATFAAVSLIGCVIWLLIW